MKLVARAAAILIAAAVCGWLLMRWAYEPLHCNTALAKVAGRTTQAETTRAEFLRLARIRANRDELRALERRCGTDVRLYMLMAANEELLGLTEETVRTYEKALTVDQRPEIHTSLGWALIRLGRYDEAARHYAIAVRFRDMPLDEIPSEVVQRRVVEIVRGSR